MGSSRRATATLIAVAVLAVAAVGVTAAVAQSDDGAVATDPQGLLERLDELEPQLPDDTALVDVQTEEDESWGEIQGDATSVRAVLDTVEPDLRQLFVDADDAEGEVADAVALVARGWLDVWTGSASISADQSHDLAFPEQGTDDLDVAVGGDELRGQLEIGLELVLLGRERQLQGYTALRRLGEAEPSAQSRLDGRATAAEDFDRDTRPALTALLSRPSTVVLVPTDRFETDAPGVRSRASSMTVVCLDREAYERAESMGTEDLLEQLGDAEVDRADCLEEPADLDE